MSKVFQWDGWKDSAEKLSQTSGHSILELSNIDIDQPIIPLLDFIEANRSTITDLSLCNSRLVDIDFHAIIGYIAESLKKLSLHDVKIVFSIYHDRLRKYKLKNLEALSIHFSSSLKSFDYIASVLEMENLLDLDYYTGKEDELPRSEAIVEFIAAQKRLEKLKLKCRSAVLSLLANHKSAMFQVNELHIEHCNYWEFSVFSIALVDHLVQFFQRQTLKKLTVAGLAFENLQMAHIMTIESLEHFALIGCSFIAGRKYGIMNTSIKLLELHDMQPDTDGCIDRGLSDIVRECHGLQKLILVNTRATEEMAYECNTYCKQMTEIEDNGTTYQFMDHKSRTESAQDLKSF